MTNKRNKYSRPWPIGTVVHLQNKIWLNPDYQREEVWTTSQKQLLIDSILRDFDLPKFYFREISKKYDYEVVDGQQRLKAIFEFENNKFRLSEYAHPIDKYEIAGKKFNELEIDIQHEFLGKSIDIVHLVGFSDDDIEEMFLRLQNGTPLNAQEKRNAIGGNVRDIVKKLSKHAVFKQAAFSNKRFAHEDATAKILHLILNGKITDIKPLSVRRTYENNPKLNEADSKIKRLRYTFNYLNKAFKQHDKSAGFKKYSILSLTFLVYEMLDSYDLNAYPKEFARTYLNFELKRKVNEEKPEAKQDAVLTAFTDAARSDGIPDLEYRDKILKREILLGIPQLTLKDPVRGFTDEQRQAVYWREKGICNKCNEKCDENEFEVDHIKPHSRGGLTRLENAQLLCISCNRKKGAKI